MGYSVYCSTMHHMVRHMRHMDKYDIAQHLTAQPSVTDTSLSIDPPTEKPQKRIQSEVQN